MASPEGAAMTDAIPARCPAGATEESPDPDLSTVGVSAPALVGTEISPVTKDVVIRVSTPGLGIFIMTGTSGIETGIRVGVGTSGAFAVLVGASEPKLRLTDEVASVSTTGLFFVSLAIVRKLTVATEAGTVTTAVDFFVASTVYACCASLVDSAMTSG